jgi:hypothetical protein
MKKVWPWLSEHVYVVYIKRDEDSRPMAYAFENSLKAAKEMKDGYLKLGFCRVLIVKYERPLRAKGRSTWGFRRKAT